MRNRKGPDINKLALKVLGSKTRYQMNETLKEIAGRYGEATADEVTRVATQLRENLNQEIRDVAALLEIIKGAEEQHPHSLELQAQVGRKKISSYLFKATNPQENDEHSDNNNSHSLSPSAPKK